jgi:Uma2 family endonuclease
MITLEQALAEPPPPPLIHYPESDGKPMGDNDQQRRWMTKIIDNLTHLFAERPDVYVSGNLFWYPVEGNNRIVQAPDAMVVFGRHPGLRGCYKQWEEGGIAPQVVFEILSPCNTSDELIRKRAFYQKYGVEEFYLLDPETSTVEGWQRGDTGLKPISRMNGWRSPRLGVTFHFDQDHLELHRPDGRPFTEGWESMRRADQEAERAQRLAAKLRALGIDPDQP